MIPEDLFVVNSILHFILCSPYSSADLKTMATAFNMTVSQLENELMSLIIEGQIQATIDSHNKVL